MNALDKGRQFGCISVNTRLTRYEKEIVTLRVSTQARFLVKHKTRKGPFNNPRERIALRTIQVTMAPQQESDLIFDISLSAFRPGRIIKAGRPDHEGGSLMSPKQFDTSVALAHVDEPARGQSSSGENSVLNKMNHGGQVLRIFPVRNARTRKSLIPPVQSDC